MHGWIVGPTHGTHIDVVIFAPPRVADLARGVVSLKPVLRSLRLFLLVWSVLLTPQIALVHALSHTLADNAASAGANERQHASDKVCDSCLALAQLGAALPAQFDFALPGDAVSTPPSASVHAADVQPLLAFRARAPPASLI
jgi:hypothetical protein